MNVVFMGTPDFAVPTLEALLISEHKVQAVFTQPDRPRGRHGTPSPSPVKQKALKADIPIYQPQKIRDNENIEILKSYAPDVIVVAAFGQIIPKAILELPKYGCINVHASLLPAYRGAAPIQWAVINGEKISGVTTMQMSEGLDTGDMLLQTKVALSDQETGGSLFEKLSYAGAGLLIDTLSALSSGQILPQKQPARSTTAYASMLTKEMGNIDWHKSAIEIERLVRGLDPWPGTYTYCRGRMLKVWKSRICSDPALCGKDDGDSDSKNKHEEPGIAGKLLVKDDHIYVQTGHGMLELLELQLEGKKRLTADAFLRGSHFEEGTILQRQR